MSSASDGETAPVRGGFSITLCVVIPDVNLGQPEARLEPAHVLKRDLVAPCEPDDQAGCMRLVLVIPKDVTVNQRGHLLEKFAASEALGLERLDNELLVRRVAQVDRPSAAHDGIGEAGERRRSRVCVAAHATSSAGRVQAYFFLRETPDRCARTRCQSQLLLSLSLKTSG